MAQTGETYMQAMNALGGPGATKGPADVSLRSLLTTLAVADRSEDARMNIAYTELEARGYRLIDGGQVDDDRWELLDFRSGKVLAQGTVDHDDWDDAISGLDADNTMYHVDAVHDDVRPNDLTDAINTLARSGIPEELLDAMANWVSMASDEDLSEVIDQSTVERAVSSIRMK